MPKVLTKKDGENLANKHGGKCLKESKSSRDKWLWECLCGNSWYASYAQIKNGSWCPNCRKGKVTISRLQQHVEKFGGQVLSNECKNIFTKVKWKCKNNHIWESIPSNVLYKNKWCPVCAKNKKLNICIAQEIANNRNAILLSTEYKNNSQKLKWVCEGGHEFNMSLNSIRNNGHWCPYCRSWNSEEICRAVFEKVFNCRFIKSRPNWLVNEYNNNLELDGLSEIEINGKYIAFEHNGLQHYVDNYLPSNLGKVQNHDRIKKKLCHENNVLLFVIPHLFKKTKLENLVPEIKKQANVYGISVNADINIDLSKVYLLSNKLKQYSDIINKKGGVLLSNTYLNCKNKLKIECSNGHIFYASSNSIKNGSWCSYCNKNAKLTIEEMRNIADSKNGKCISKKYINAKTKLMWECKCGHQWKAAPYSIKSGSWCPKCARQKK